MRHLQWLLSAAVLATALATAGCNRFPQLEAVISDQARQTDYPVLTPPGGLLAMRDAGRLTENDGQALLRRVNMLRARAALLRGVSIDDQTRRRLAARLHRLGG